MRRFYELLLNFDDKIPLFEEEGKSYYKADVLKKVELYRARLLEINCAWQGKQVYFDMKDRKSFIFLFFALSSLEAGIVLIPVEIANSEFIGEDVIYLTDNKPGPKAIYLDNEGQLNCNGIDFARVGSDESYSSLYLYTSGSTGKAKMVPKGFSHLLVELEELKGLFGVKRGEVFYYTSPLYHIYGFLFGLLLPLYCHARVILDYHFTPESVCDFVAKEPVDFFISIPSYYLFFKKIEKVALFRKCRHLISSSAPLPAAVSESFYQDGVSIREIYGSTETGGIAHRVSAVDANWQTFSYVKVVSKDLELSISSPAISVDYPVDTGYSTGDVVTFNDEGRFQLTGRNMSFVKIGGKRVNLNYVQVKYRSYLESLTGRAVDENSFFVGENGGKIFLISEEPFPGTSLEVKNSLKEYLPGYAIPKVLIHMQIPRNRMGKINRREIDKLLNNISS